MKLFDKITYSILAIAMSLIMLHLVYVHAELLDHLNPYSKSFFRSVLFSVAYSFLTLTVVALLQSDKWNKLFAVADAVAVALYYAEPIFTDSFSYYILFQSIFYSTLTGVATYTLGSLSLKYFSSFSKESIDEEKEALKNRVDTLYNSLSNEVEKKESLIEKNDSIKIALKKLMHKYEKAFSYREDALKYRLRIAKIKKDNDFEIDEIKKEIESIQNEKNLQHERETN